jgi:uncharacterized protein YeaO (DUF488 family)
MARSGAVQVKRAYDARKPEDGARILVDRLWPRGLAKDEAHIDAWERDVAPSSELRTWFGHDEDRFPEFARRYRRELHGSVALERLRSHLAYGPLTLITATRSVETSHAAVLAALIRNTTSA